MHDTSYRRTGRSINTRSGHRQNSLFGREPTHPHYAIEYHFASTEQAHHSARWAMKKFHENKPREAKELIKHMTLFAANKAEAMSENRRLNETERKKFREIHHIYKNAYQNMHIPEQRHEYQHAASQRHRKSGFPKNPHRGERHSIVRTVKGRRRKLTFEATGHSGKQFGIPKWVMVSNEEA